MTTINPRDEYQLVYNRLKLKDKADDIRVVKNTRDKHNKSYAIRIPTIDLSSEGRKGGTDLDFIFTGPDSEAICERIKNLLTKSCSFEQRLR